MNDGKRRGGKRTVFRAAVVVVVMVMVMIMIACPAYLIHPYPCVLGARHRTDVTMNHDANSTAA
jgi:zona occludens toxin (predicted ATPase)